MDSKVKKSTLLIRISVIIPTYNRGYVVCEALESVLAQTYSELEVILVDDGSSDDTRALIKPYLADKRVSYIYQKNAGVSNARNKGVSLARGEFVSFLDSDDLWKPDKLELEVDFLSKNTELKVVFSDLEEYVGKTFKPSFMRDQGVLLDLLSTSFPQEGGVLDKNKLFFCLLEEFTMHLCAFTVGKDVFQELGGLDESLISGEDWEFFIRLTRTYNCGYINRPLAVIRRSHDSLHGSTLESSYKGTLKVLEHYSKELENDKVALARLRISTNNITRKLYRFYLGKGQKLAAFKLCMQSFEKTHTIGMLLRAAAAFVPVKLLFTIKHYILRDVHLPS